MKTTLTYGFAIALAGGLVTAALFFLGYHSDPEKISAAQWIGLPLYVLITVVALYLGTKARAEEVPATEPFGYGRAFGNAMLIVLFASLFGIITNFVYFKYINPDLLELMGQSQIAKLEAKGANASAIEQAERGIHMMMKPGIITGFAFVQSIFGGTILALITSAFARRSATSEPPALA